MTTVLTSANKEFNTKKLDTFGKNRQTIAFSFLLLSLLLFFFFFCTNNRNVSMMMMMM